MKALLKKRKQAKVQMFAAFGMMAVALCVLVLGTPGSANAVLTAGQQAAVDGVTTLITDLETVSWAIVLSMTAWFVGIRLFKKGINRAV